MFCKDIIISFFTRPNSTILKAPLYMNITFEPINPSFTRLIAWKCHLLNKSDEGARQVKKASNWCCSPLIHIKIHYANLKSIFSYLKVKKNIFLWKHHCIFVCKKLLIVEDAFSLHVEKKCIECLCLNSHLQTIFFCKIFFFNFFLNIHTKCYFYHL